MNVIIFVVVAVLVFASSGIHRAQSAVTLTKEAGADHQDEDGDGNLSSPSLQVQNEDSNQQHEDGHEEDSEKGHGASVHNCEEEEIILGQGLAKWFDCTRKTNGFYPNRKDPTAFIACVSGYAWNMKCTGCPAQRIVCPEGRMIFDSATRMCLPGNYFSTMAVSDSAPGECSSKYTYTKLPEEKWVPCPCPGQHPGHPIPAPGSRDAPAPAPSHQKQQQEPGGHDHGQNMAELVQQTQIVYECPENKVWDNHKRICEACSKVLRKNGEPCC